MTEKRLVQMYWGDGKGKTTASLGLGFRAAGSGLRVHLVQFMKSGHNLPDEGCSNTRFQRNRCGTEKVDLPGEIRAIEQVENFTWERFGAKGWAMEENREKHAAAARKGLDAAGEKASSGEYDVLILDEVLYAVSMGLLDEQDVLDVVEARDEGTELILTGSHERLPGIEAAADLVTQIKKVKHPFDEGIPARKGIEY